MKKKYTVSIFNYEGQKPSPHEIEADNVAITPGSGEVTFTNDDKTLVAYFRNVDSVLLSVGGKAG